MSVKKGNEVNKKHGRYAILMKYLRFHSSVYSRVILVIGILSVLLFISYAILFRSVKEQYMNTLIRENGDNIGSMVEGALYHSMLRNDKTELYNTLDLINTLSGIDEVNLYDHADYLVYSSYSLAASHYNDPDCLNCHTALSNLFNGNEKAYRVIGIESACSMYMLENSQRYLLIRNPIRNEPSCYTAACHAHNSSDEILGSLIIKMPLGHFDEAMQKSSSTYFILAIIITVFLTTVLVFFTRKNIKEPLYALVNASRAVAGGDWKTRLKVKSSQLEDVNEVSTAFNEMLDKLQSATNELENWSKQLEYKVQKKSEELSAVQNELIQIERIASLGKMSASVAHELNNPLSGILVYSKLVQKQLRNPSLDEEKMANIYKHLSLIENETKRCGEIVRGLLDFSKKDQIDHEPAHLNEILAGSYELMQHPLRIANISFYKDLKARKDLILCSPNQIKQACIALLVNSSESMHHEAPGEIILCTSNPDTDHVMFEVIDNGTGIASENLPFIFEPFFSTKHEASGIGLGLAIVHGIVQSHRGHIKVESELNKGTIISIRLPLIQQKEN
jgi:two-component system, NtrC family, sensor kinase